jgi:hypothetical protein
MNVVTRVTSLAFVLSVLLVPLQATTAIRILSGSLEFAAGDAVFDIKGTDAFRFLGGGNISGGRFDPANDCGFGCPPGTSVSLGASWSGLDLGGTATLRGRVWRVGEERPDGAFMGVEFNGTVTLPPMNDGGTVQVSAPFTFSGQFTYPSDNPQATVPLAGSGVATLNFVADSERTSWVFVSARYEFQPAP